MRIAYNNGEYKKTDFYTNTHAFRRMEFSEIKELKAGDKVTICIYMDALNKANFIDATVVQPLFWNSDADEPDWEIETTNGFVDTYSIYKAIEVEMGYMPETKKVWWIECRTGCTCCAYENFDQGFYFNEEEPEAIIERWSHGDGNPLASQYAKYGQYHLCESEAEILPDGRMIIDGTVFEPDEVNDVGHITW